MNIPECSVGGIPKMKRKRVHSSSSSSVDGTVLPTGKKRRARERRLDHSLKELKEELKEGLKEGMTQILLSFEEFQKKLSEAEASILRVTEEMNELKNAILLTRPFPISSQVGNVRNLKLQCQTKMARRTFTESKLVGDQGTDIHIVLIDADTNQIITTGIESSIKVHVVVLEGDFNREDHENWSREEFDNFIVKERLQRRPLLIGDLQVTLKEGVGSLHNLTFTDNSSWNRSKMFRIGVQVASGYCEGTRIREALTEPFSVLEHRGESYMKHYPPMSSDYVWRLEWIGKDGKFHKRLNDNGIGSVEEFLQAYSKSQHTLRIILGNGMTKKKWDLLIDHAKTCPPNGKYYVFYRDVERNYGLLFDNFAHIVGLIQNGVPQAISTLSDLEKREVDALVKIAHQNWKDVTEYAGLHGHSVIERSIIPCPAAAMLAPAAATLARNHSGIPSCHSFGLQDFPIQISLPDHIKSSEWLHQGLASLHNVNADSVVAAEQASTSQQVPVQAGPTPIPSPLVPSPSSSYHFASCGSPSTEFFNFDEFLRDSTGSSFEGNNMHHNLHSCASVNPFTDLPDFISGKEKAIIRWFKVKAVLKWGFISKKRSVATLIEL